MSTEEVRVPGLYFTVIDGSFRTKVDETHPQAVRREYETKDGSKAVKYERIVTSLNGFIEDIGIYEGDFGRTVNIKLDANADGKNPIIQLSAEGTFGEDFLKKLPNIDLTKQVRLRPFAFTDDHDREVRGISVTQVDENNEEVKIQNFFYKPSETEGERGEVINGYPVPEGDTDNYSKDDWKIHFLKCRKFLIEYFQANILNDIPSKVAQQKRESAPKPKADDYPEEEINPEDIPF